MFIRTVLTYSVSWKFGGIPRIDVGTFLFCFHLHQNVAKPVELISWILGTTSAANCYFCFLLFFLKKKWKAAAGSKPAIWTATHFGKPTTNESFHVNSVKKKEFLETTTATRVLCFYFKRARGKKETKLIKKKAVNRSKNSFPNKKKKKRSQIGGGKRKKIQRRRPEDAGDSQNPLETGTRIKQIKKETGTDVAPSIRRWLEDAATKFLVRFVNSEIILEALEEKFGSISMK